MCPFGYDNVTVGLCLGWFIGTGSVGSLVFGYFADRTGKLEEISKILYAASSVAYILLVLVRQSRFLVSLRRCSLILVYYQSCVKIFDLFCLCFRWFRFVAIITDIYGSESRMCLSYSRSHCHWNQRDVQVENLLFQ